MALSAEPSIKIKKEYFFIKEKKRKGKIGY